MAENSRHIDRFIQSLFQIKRRSFLLMTRLRKATLSKTISGPFLPFWDQKSSTVVGI
jgi:hypothetical protein